MLGILLAKLKYRLATLILAVLGGTVRQDSVHICSCSCNLGPVWLLEIVEVRKKKIEITSKMNV